MRPLALLTIFLFATPFLFGQQQRSSAPKSHTEHAQGTGCVRPGKEEGCFLLHDIKQHRYYGLSFEATNTKPDLYTAIWFEGIGYPHDAHCSQGKPVHVSHWKPAAGKCTRRDSGTATKKK
jgi:hypothetical protein